MKKKDTFKIIAITFVILGICIIVIPYSINKLLYLPIETNSTNDSDWLSFWGSFLGGIIGGLSTLGGVLLTIYIMKQDKRDEDKKNKPVIVPLNKHYYIIKNKEIKGIKRIRIYKSLEYRENGGYDVYNEFINVGKEHALNIDIAYSLPNLNSIEKYLENAGINSDKYIMELRNICKSKNCGKKHFQFIKSLDVLKDEMLFDINCQMLICKIVDIISDENSGFRIIKDIPAGKIDINYTNTYGSKFKSEYLITTDVFTMFNEVGTTEYSGELEFRGIENISSN